MFAIEPERDQLVVDELTRRFGADILSHEKQYDLQCFTVKKEALHAVLQFLRDDAVLQFNFLTTLCGMHHPEREELGLVIHLHSFVHGHRLRLKSSTPISDPTFTTFTTLWPTANWMEREAYDFYGIIFTGHPNLKRILNMEDFPAFPMRKDYPLEDQTREDKDDTMFGR